MNAPQFEDTLILRP